MSSKSYHSSIHEESSFPAELLHRQLQHSGLRDGAFVDVQSALKMEITDKKGRLREHISNTVSTARHPPSKICSWIFCTFWVSICLLFIKANTPQCLFRKCLLYISLVLKIYLFYTFSKSIKQNLNDVHFASCETLQRLKVLSSLPVLTSSVRSSTRYREGWIISME